MTDKEKLNRVIAEIKRLIADYNIKTEKYRGMNEQAHQYYGGKRDALSEILKSIDSMQKEPVSKDLEEASKEWLRPQLDKSYANYGEAKMMELTHFDGYAMLDAIEFGVKWKEQQLEKNRLKHCDTITNEQAELEQGFIDQHLDKHQRMPTFLDAIEYGMKLQKEQMMKDSVLCGVDGWFINNKRNCRKNGRFYKYYESTITHDKPLPMENGKDYRLITIKEG